MDTDPGLQQSNYDARIDPVGGGGDGGQQQQQLTTDDESTPISSPETDQQSHHVHVQSSYHTPAATKLLPSMSTTSSTNVPSSHSHNLYKREQLMDHSSDNNY